VSAGLSLSTTTCHGISAVTAKRRSRNKASADRRESDKTRRHGVGAVSSMTSQWRCSSWQWWSQHRFGNDPVSLYCSRTSAKRIVVIRLSIRRRQHVGTALCWFNNLHTTFSAGHKAIENSLVDSFKRYWRLFTSTVWIEVSFTEFTVLRRSFSQTKFITAVDHGRRQRGVPVRWRQRPNCQLKFTHFRCDRSANQLTLPSAFGGATSEQTILLAANVYSLNVFSDNIC